MNVQTVNLTYGGGGYSTAAVGFSSGNTGTATATATINPGNIMTPGTPPTSLRVSTTAGVQASPITEIFTYGGEDLLFYGFGSATTNSYLASENVTTSGSLSAGTGSPYQVPDGAGGTSGIVVDNISSSAGASSIYFAELGGTGGSGGGSLTIQQVCDNTQDSPPDCVTTNGKANGTVAFYGP